jgi:hypothetical protein
MRKFSPTLFELAPPRRRSRSRVAIMILLGLLLSPLVFEATLLCTARWKGMIGVEPHVKTPVLNALGDGLRSAGEDIRLTLAPVLHQLPWNPSYVVVFGLVWASIGVLMLRR